MKKAFVLINCDLGKEKDLISDLNEIKNVRESHGTWGAYDIIAEVESETAESLRETITWKIRKMPAIRATLTLMAIEGQE
ncbi:MAG: Lrp/AsnC ligand binding domain-containing protein [Nitrosopumilus sp.]|nr:Lrp/AsnC ligand binding domain-containing protein [Nitrosopumilus sp.]